MPSSPSARALVRCASTEDLKEDKRNCLQHGWAALAISIVDLPRTAIAIVGTANHAPSPLPEFAKEPAAACYGPGRLVLTQNRETPQCG